MEVYFPAIQAIHADASVEPVFGLAVPAAQFVQDMDPVEAAYVPTGHIVHAVAPVVP
jgi:hypothetical protein